MFGLFISNYKAVIAGPRHGAKTVKIPDNFRPVIETHRLKSPSRIAPLTAMRHPYKPEIMYGTFEKLSTYWHLTLREQRELRQGTEEAQIDARGHILLPSDHMNYMHRGQLTPKKLKLRFVGIGDIFTLSTQRQWEENCRRIEEYINTVGPKTLLRRVFPH